MRVVDIGTILPISKSRYKIGRIKTWFIRKLFTQNFLCKRFDLHDIKIQQWPLEITCRNCGSRLV